MDLKKIARRREAWTLRGNVRPRPGPKSKTRRIPTNVKDHFFMQKIVKPLKKWGTKEARHIIVKMYLFILNLCKLAEEMDDCEIFPQVNCNFMKKSQFLTNIGLPLEELIYNLCGNEPPNSNGLNFKVIILSYLQSKNVLKNINKAVYNELSTSPPELPVGFVEPNNCKNRNLKYQHIPVHVRNDVFIRNLYIPLLDFAGRKAPHDIKMGLYQLLKYYVFYVEISKTAKEMDEEYYMKNIFEKHFKKYEKLTNNNIPNPDLFIIKAIHPFIDPYAIYSSDKKNALTALIASYVNTLNQLRKPRK